MRALILSLFVAFALCASAARADEAGSDPEPQVTSVEPFRAAMVSNMSIAAHAVSTMKAIAKQPAPKTMSATQRKIYGEQSKWLRTAATRLHGLHAKMQQVLAKSAGATEIATVNMEFVHVRDEIESESHRYDAAAKARNTTALQALKHHDAPTLAALTR